MTKIIQRRMTADVEGEFVVFLIGLRINKPWKIHKWLPITNAMRRMIEELYQHPDLGFVSHESWFGRTTIMVQYWKSFEQLDSYARRKSSSHLPAWEAFNKKVGSNGDVGIWHETYLSQKGKYESVYNNMPKFGLAKVGAHIPAEGKFKSADDRVKRS
jgi:hypothetical protein|tara:strand:+ start:329 stop:802 length:474 start_codon:yes stop_codon:yes gene_type:complete